MLNIQKQGGCIILTKDKLTFVCLCYIPFLFHFRQKSQVHIAEISWHLLWDSLYSCCHWLHCQIDAIGHNLLFILQHREMCLATFVAVNFWGFFSFFSQTCFKSISIYLASSPLFFCLSDCTGTFHIQEPFVIHLDNLLQSSFALFVFHFSLYHILTIVSLLSLFLIGSSDGQTTSTQTQFKIYMEVPFYF